MAVTTEQRLLNEAEMREVGRTIRLANQLVELTVWSILSDRERLSKEFARRAEAIAAQLTPGQVQGVLASAQSLLEPYRVAPKKKSKSKSKKKDAKAKD